MFTNLCHTVDFKGLSENQKRTGYAKSENQESENKMTIFERVAHAKQVWELMLPSKSAPDTPTLARWIAEYSDEEMAFAIGRTSKKSHHCPEKDAPELHRYCAGILKNERLAPQRTTS
jgi:hypothetical protein